MNRRGLSIGRMAADLSGKYFDVFPESCVSSARRASAIAVVAAPALTAGVPSAASTASHGKSLTATTGMTDVSARRRGFNPAAAVAGVVGLGIAAAAAANSRAYYDDSYGYYGGGPVYAGPRRVRITTAVTAAMVLTDREPADQNGHPLASW